MTQDTTATATETTATETPAFTPTGTPTQVLVSYLKDRVSADADAPHRGLPFIDGKDNVRVKPSDFTDWFTSEKPYTGEEPAKKVMLAMLKDAGLVQKVYALPAHEAHPELTGKSFGLYTGPAPAGTKTLARRVVERKAPTTKETTTVTDTPAAETAAPAESNGIERVAASTLKVGDTIGTTRSDTRKAIEAGPADRNATGRDRGNGVSTIAAITEGPGGRIQARDDAGKMIRSMEPTTEVWVKRA